MGTETIQSVESEALEAYFDCWGGHPFDEAGPRRSLRWRAGETVSRDEAVRIMRAALADHGSYNEFKPEALALLPEGSAVVLSRENSVCVYVDRLIWHVLADRMKADEWSVTNDGGTRLWWD